MSQPNLLLLHGALGSIEQFDPLLPFLQDHCQLHRLDFEGHGRSPLRTRPFRMEHFAEDVIEYLDQHSIEHTNIFGYSLGGYVACYLALTHSQRVKRVATLGTKFVWNAEVAQRETALLDTDKIQAKVPKFAQALADRHTTTDWKIVLEHTRDLLWSLADRNLLDTENLKRITQPALIIVGDQDSTVNIEEADTIAQSLMRGQTQLLANTVHPFEKVPHEQLAQLLIEFFERLD
jgi:pimeloyl-ACP methyl ester carboxylesterase